MADFTLSDVEIVAVSLCKGPANRKRFFLKKQDGDPDLTLPAPHALIKGDDWSVVYAVVAEPGHEEGAGIGDGAIPGKTDIWKNDDEIRLSAHRFMRNGGLVNRAHQSLEPYGQVVENFIAPVDMVIAGEQIKKGSWCIGIEPTEEGKRLIDKGDWDGVSYEGNGVRTPVNKLDPAKPAQYGKCDNCGAKVVRGSAKCPNCGKTVTLAKQFSAEAASQAHGPILNLARHYMKKPHPFRACVRDNTKRFGKARAEMVCARLKDIGHGGSTGWRGGMKKADDIPYELVDTMARNWLEAGLTADDATMAFEVLSQTDDRSLLHKIADKLGISVDEEDSANEEDDVALTDEQTASLAKVDGLEEKVAGLDSKLDTLTSRLGEVVERLPEKPKDPDEERAELQKSVDDLATKLDDTRERLEKLAEGDSQQDTGDDKTDLQKGDADQQLAHALFS